MKQLAAVAVFAACLGLSAGAPAGAQASPRQSSGQTRPKLVVFLVIDQMRADYLSTYGSLLEKGLKRLTTQGAWYKNAAYPYASTITCVGHTTIGTGTFPYKHGMIQNAWWDRESAKAVTCNADPESTEISYANFSGAGDTATRMLVPTLADVMRESLKSRVATMSNKARSAIGLAGHKGDFVVWFGDRGAWETSSAYATAPLPWFASFIKGNPASRDSEKVWERSLPEQKYEGDDAAPGEREISGWTAKFPHPLGKAGDAAYLQRWLVSPYADDILGEVAQAAVSELKLGQEDRVDFLGVSFSMLDSVGHAFGPRSHEVQDTIVRVDRTIGKLLDFLDEKVGAGNYVVALSADHGVAALPEQVEGGGRLNSAAVRGVIEASLAKSLGEEGPFTAAAAGSDIYLKPGVYDRLKAAPAAVKALVEAVSGIPGVARLLTADQISTPAARTSKDALIRTAALSYYPGRSGDLFLIPREHWILAAVGTTHGTLNSYDQKVPVLLYGAGIRAGARNDAATPADLAVTIAQMIGVTLPSPDGKVLVSALAK